MRAQRKELPSTSAMLTKTIFFLLFLGLPLLSVSEHHDRNDTIASPMILHKNTNSVVLVNPSQVNILEKTLQRFLSRIAEPIKGPFVLKPNGNDLQLTIRKICQSIRKKLMQFAKDCDLTRTVQRYEKNSDFSRTEDWSSEVLLQGTLMFYNLGNMANEIQEGIRLYFNDPNISFQIQKTSNLRFLNVFYDATDFSERLSQCLLQMENRKQSKASFDINRAIFKMAKYPPDVALKTFKSNMNSSLNTYPKSYTGHRSWYAFLCFSIVKKQGTQYDDCIRDIQNLESCLRDTKHETDRNMNGLEMKPWMKAIQRLSDCKVQEDRQGKLQIFCNSSSKVPKEIKQKIRYMFERTLNRKISRKSPLHKAANDLGDILSRYNWGQRIIDELCQYFAIHEDGTRKLQKLSALAGKDKRARRRYEEVARALKVYKKGLILRTSKSINKMHRSATDFEKYFINGIKITLNESWQSHVRILSSLMDWMTKLLELHVGINISGNEQSKPEDSVPTVESKNSESSELDDDYESESRQSHAPRSKTEMMQRADTAMTNLIKSMNQVVKQRNVNNRSMLACLANNLLLVVMFAETMGLVSTLFCAGYPTTGGNSFNSSDEEWLRERRSYPLDLHTLDYEEDADLLSEDHFLLQIRENLTALTVDRN